MTTQQASDKLKGVATVWQLVVSISTTVIAILIYILSIRYDVNANSGSDGVEFDFNPTSGSCNAKINFSFHYKVNPS